MKRPDLVKTIEAYSMKTEHGFKSKHEDLHGSSWFYILQVRLGPVQPQVGHCLSRCEA